MKKNIIRQLHVFVGEKCNNNCIFCMDNNFLGKKTKKQILEEIRKNQNIRNIVFTSQEPTLNNNLPEFIHSAKKDKYRSIALVTNGRMLSYKALAEKLIESGLNEITVSLHGHNEELHDYLTQSPSSFVQTKKALENLTFLKKRYDFRLGIATTVNEFNLKDLNQINKFAGSFPIDFHVFNIFEPRGKAKAKFFLIPKYSEVVNNFKKMDKKLFPEIIVTELPLCIAKKIETVLGSNKNQFHIDSNDKIVETEFSNEKEKRKECKKCIQHKRCEGVWKDYIIKYGWEEFIPVEIK